MHNDLFASIESDFKAAMLAKDEFTKTALRLLKTSITVEEKVKGQTLSEDDLYTVVEKNVKSIDKQIQTYVDLNQPDLVLSLNKEKAIVAKYLPPYIDDEELDTLIEDVMQNIEKRKMGDVIMKVTQKLGNKRVDRTKMINKIQQKLNA